MASELTSCHYNRVWGATNLRNLALKNVKLTFTKATVYALAAMTLCILIAATLLPPVGAPEYFLSLEQGLSSPVAVRKLRLAHQGLTELPNKIMEFPNLETLTLLDNKLTNLPDWFPQNSSIVTLELSGNQFQSFPPQLTKMGNLEELYIARNSIEELPSSIGNIKLLQALDLGHNKLRDVPDNISELGTLRYLNLRGNPLPPSVREKIRKLLPNTRIDFGDPSDNR